MKKQKRSRRAFVCELLEPRCVLSGFQLLDAGDFYPVIVAGDPVGTPADSPANRIDANTSASPFAGVGSLQIAANRGTYICTGTPIDAFHVLTAAHCVDINNDGVSNKKDGIKSITFNLNLDIDSGTDAVDVKISATSWRTHPDFTGFNRPSINDDLAVITLGGSGVPAVVPTYSLASANMVAGATRLYLVGYGRSGNGVTGYTTNASFTVKRDGENMVDAFYTQDDANRALTNEVFRFDFDGPSGNGSMGGSTLGNDKETTLGGGDSGGPSFIRLEGSDPSSPASYQLAGVNTFTQGFNAPKFGSLGGGINVFPYSDWILSGTAPTAGSSVSSGSKGKAGSIDESLENVLSGDESLGLIVLHKDILADSTARQTSLVTFSIAANKPSHVTLVSTSAVTDIASTETSSNESSKFLLPIALSTDTDRQTEISYDNRFNELDEIFDLQILDEILEPSIAAIG